MRAAARLIYGEIEPSCSMCRKPDMAPLRELWGCDKPAEGGGVYEINCERCHGSDAKCELCEGTGMHLMDRCPGSMITREVRDLMAVYGSQAEHGIWPVPGGRFVQTANLHRWLSVINAERIDAETDKRKNAS